MHLKRSSNIFKIQPDTNGYILPLEQNIEEANWILQRLPELGISIDKITQQLEEGGVGKFIEPFGKLMKALTKKSLPATAHPSAG